MGYAGDMVSGIRATIVGDPLESQYHWVASNLLI